MASDIRHHCKRERHGTAGELGLADYPALHRWSVENRQEYWQRVIQRLGIRFRQPYAKIVDASQPTRPLGLSERR